MIDSEIALRCFNIPESNGIKKSNTQIDLKIPNRVLVFDTETTIDEYQNLKFGYFEIYDRGILEFKGLFYDPTIKDKEMKILNYYSKSNNINLYPVRKFIDDIFYPEIYELKTLCIGYNLPFDLSRLAISFNTSKKRGEHNAFSFKLSEDKENPRLIIKHNDRNSSFIKFTNGFSWDRGNFRHNRNKPKKFRGNFLDLKTLTFALTNKSHSLESACNKFKTETRKIRSETHGKITPKYIEYNINDVKATHSLYLKLKAEFENYNLKTPITKLYSPASIGKGYIKEMNIKPFLEKNPKFPKEILGYMMTTYYGGRSEVRYRKKPIEINLIDFLSMYPTVNILQNLWKFVIAEKVKCFDDTENLKKLVESITLKDLQNLETWKLLTAIVQVLPDKDILPIRSKYGNKETYNIGLNYLTSSKPIWYTLSDVIASKLLTGKAPMILKGYRFKPIEIQPDLKPITIIGNKRFNPDKEDLFKTLIEYRVSIKNKMKAESNNYEYYNNLQNNIKIIANSTSYGIYVEINTEIKKEKVSLDVYGLERFNVKTNRIEKFGKAFNPILAIFITSASRLILAITERILIDNDSNYAFCDTDSMAIEPKLVESIQKFFQSINPYSFDKPLFELEKENYNEKTNELEPLYFYGISAKRYVLFNLINGKPFIRKYSSHGLGHLLNPFNDKNKNWDKTIWEDILNEVYGITDSTDNDNKYQDKYCISQLTISSPEIMKRLTALNKNKIYNKQIKPFNFVLIGTSNQKNPKTNKPIKPFVPFTQYYQSIPINNFIDYNSGKVMKGIEYWKSFDYMFWKYKNHLEDKFDGDIGLLDRKQILIDKIVYLGKESNKIEESQVLGVNKKSYVKYINKVVNINYPDINKYKLLIFKLTPKLTIPYGINKRQLTRMRKKVKENKPLRLTKKIKIKLEFLINKHSIN